MHAHQNHLTLGRQLSHLRKQSQIVRIGQLIVEDHDVRGFRRGRERVNRSLCAVGFRDDIPGRPRVSASAQQMSGSSSTTSTRKGLDSFGIVSLHFPGIPWRCGCGSAAPSGPTFVPPRSGGLQGPSHIAHWQPHEAVPTVAFAAERLQQSWMLVRGRGHLRGSSDSLPGRKLCAGPRVVEFLTLKSA